MHKWVNNWRNLRHIVITCIPCWKIVKSYVKNNFQIWTLLLLNATTKRYIKYEHYYYWTILLNATSNMNTTTTERLSVRRFENSQLIKKLNFSRVTLWKILATFHIWRSAIGWSMDTNHHLMFACNYFWNWYEVALWWILDQTEVTMKNRNSLYNIKEKAFALFALLALKILCFKCKKIIEPWSMMAKYF